MGQPKLSLPLGAGMVVSPVLDLAKEISGPESVFVVLRPEVENALKEEVERKGLQIVVADRAAEGQAESLKAGVKAVESLVRFQRENVLEYADGALVFLADQPNLKRETAQAVVAAFDGENAVAAAFNGQRGHPVLLPRRAFAAVLELKGDTGARQLLQGFGLRLMPSSDRAVLQDVDTPEAYAACLDEWESGNSPL